MSTTEWDDTLYTLCAVEDCPFFIAYNSSRDDDSTVAEYVHLHRGDATDEAQDDHDPIPGDTSTLAWWKENGPARVRIRFVEPGAYGIHAQLPGTPGAIICGTCGRAWAQDITPAGRCPWETDHEEI